MAAFEIVYQVLPSQIHPDAGSSLLIKAACHPVSRDNAELLIMWQNRHEGYLIVTARTLKALGVAPLVLPITVGVEVKLYRWNVDINENNKCELRFSAPIHKSRNAIRAYTSTDTRSYWLQALFIHMIHVFKFDPVFGTKRPPSRTR